VKVQALIEHLQTHFKPDDVIAHAIWQVDDVQMRAEALSVELSDQEAVDVVENIDRRHDAEIGINWDVLDCHIEGIAYDRLDKNLAEMDSNE
jgi:hypothetical protein